MAKPTVARRISEMGALRIVDPDKWARKVRAALKANGGFLEPAAKSLDVSSRQLARWLADDERLVDAREMVAPPSRHRPK